MAMIAQLLLLLGFLAVVSGGAQAAPLEADGVSQWLCGNDDNDNDDACPCQEDRVYRLPGRVEPLPSPWYSGYLTYDFENRTIHTHYVLVLAEQDDEDDASSETKPLIYWTNGGPGASSLFGLMTEVGPLWWDERSWQTDESRRTQIPTPMYNPYSWTKLGHVLIFDQPAPVGFSYCEGPATNNTKQEPRASVKDDNDKVDCAGLGWTDELTAQNAFAAMQAFYTKFPKLATNELYLTGESYAGIYIPTLAREILQNNQDNANNSSLPLRGWAVGDGCLGTETGLCQILYPDQPDAFDFWQVWFLAGHGQIPLRTFQQVMRACQPFHNDNDNDEILQFATDTDVCQAAVHKVHEQMGGVYDYSLYDECTYSGGSFQRRRQQMVGGALNDYPCGGDEVMAQYLNLTSVRHALHIPDGVEFFEADNAVGFDYTYTEKDLTGFYKDVATKTNLSVLIYNGDTDPAITSFAAQNWTQHLGLDVLQEWTPWTVDGCRRMGGYATRYAGALDFVTIRGAGHMVPTFKPAAMFALLQSWLTGQDSYPPYVADCVRPTTGSATPPVERTTGAAERDAEETMHKEKQTTTVWIRGAPVTNDKE